MTFLLTQWKIVVMALMIGVIGAQQMRINYAHSQFSEYKSAQLALKAAAEEANRQKEQELRSEAAKTEEAKNVEIRSINDRLDSALASLSKRPSRPSVPRTTAACAGATGAELSRPDAEFLERLAASAKTVATERDACYAQYQSAVSRLRSAQP